MKIIKEISKHEVLKRWAIGELDSEFFKAGNTIDKLEMLSMLISENEAVEVAAVEQILIFKQELVNALDPELKWYLATLELNQLEMDAILTLDVPEWDLISRSTYQLSEAAKNIFENPSLDLRITGILNGLKNSRVQLKGITLLSEDVEGPYMAIEGNARLTAIYIHNLLKNNKNDCIESIEIALGVYEK